MMQHSYSTLFLGDSYTIGESLPIYENFPGQLIQMLRRAGFSFQAPEIVAKTGWTTDELDEGLRKLVLQPEYDFVTLLIGVNNEYRGRSPEEYAIQFDVLLRKAIAFTGNKPHRLAVLSIPDWGITPFAEKRFKEVTGLDVKKVSERIDQFNSIASKIAGASGAVFFNITPGTREARFKPELLAADGLHPSEKEYERWATQLFKWITESLSI